MKDKKLTDYTVDDVSELMLENVDAIVIVDSTIDMYKAVVRRGIFQEFLDES